jgi:hypothetical protein
MEVKTTVFVQAYGDFDVRYTKCTLVHSEYKDITHLREIFAMRKGIKPSFQGNSYMELDTLTTEFIQFLIKEEGFQHLKGKEIYFTD